MLTNLTAKFREKINSDTHFAELLKGSGIAFVLRIIGIIAGYIFTLLITRGYGAEAMGTFALSFTLLQISSVIGRLGMDTALLRFVAEYSSQGKWDVVKDIYKKAIKLVLPFSMILSIAVFFLSGYIAEFVFKKPHLEPYFKIASIGIFPFVLLFIHTESLRGLKKIKEYMLLQQGGVFTLASILLGIIMLVLTNNKPAFLNQIPISIYIFSIFIISSIAFYIWIKYLTNSNPKSKIQNSKFLQSTPPNPSTTFTTSTTSTTSITSTTFTTSTSSTPSKPSTTSMALFTYKALLSVSIPMLLSSSLALIMGWTDTIMLEMFRIEKVGIYNLPHYLIFKYCGNICF